jgi:hypothetical protein
VSLWGCINAIDPTTTTITTTTTTSSTSTTRQRAAMMSTLLVRGGGMDPPLPIHTAANFAAEVKARAASLPTAWSPTTRRLERVVDPDRMSGTTHSFITLLLLVVFIAWVLRNMFAGGNHYQSHHGHSYRR